MMPIMDLINHNHNNDTGLLMINKELHTDPLRSKSYFKSGKYLNDVRLVYSNSDSESDLKGRNDVLSHGYKATDEYWK
jgi:hypothetical protein